MHARLMTVPAVVWVCALALSGCASEHRRQVARDQDNPRFGREVPPVEWTLKLKGSGLGKPAVFSFEKLAGMEMTRLDKVLMRKTHGPDLLTSWRGPSLEGLLSAAKIKPGPMKVILEAEGGYGVRCTVDDLKSAVVALQDGEGRWLAEVGERASPIRLVVPERPGNYWVRDLVLIIVEPA